MSDKKYFYITTPIYYASANLHIGHAYCETITDTIARYKRLRGYEVFFLTGADEHGEKIAKNAAKANTDPQSFVDEIAENFKRVWSAMGITYNGFIRTTSPKHMEVVQKVFTKLLEQGDIYLGEYEGWYCTPCEAFWTSTQVGENHICPDCGREVHKEKQKAYFLNCKKYVPALLDFYKSHPDFVPNGKLNEMINTFIKPGLEDLCITRSELSWGVPIKEDPKQVVYVWIDALLNYISALGYLSDDDSLFKKFWSDESVIVQFAGREINRFHTIYWPILLLALGLRLPDTIYVHGMLLTRSGVKLSKSLGNAPSPLPLIERYSVDALRYYMVSEVKVGEDGTFTPTQFINRINSDLVNSYGNLLNRSLAMVKKYFNGIVPEIKEFKDPNTIKLFEDIDLAIDNYQLSMDKYNVTEGAYHAISIANLANKYVDTMAPWALSKDPSKEEALKETMYALCEAIRVASIALKPFLVTKADDALSQLNVKGELTEYSSIKSHFGLSNIEIGETHTLFPRLNVNDEQAFLTELIDGKTK